MVSKRFIPVVVVAVLFVVPAAWALAPAGLSPGSNPGVEDVAEPCPVFTWSGVGHATGYELEVFALGGDDPPIVAVHAETPKGVTTWTPEATQCLEQDRRYAWTVRAMFPDGSSSDWSRVRLFKVLEGETVTELEDALGLRRPSQARDLPRSGTSLPEGSAPLPPVVGVNEPAPEVITPKAAPAPVFTIDGAIQFPDGTKLSTSPLPDDRQLSYRVFGTALKPRGSDVEYAASGGGGCVYASAGDAYQIFNVGVYLPQGVTVQGIRMYFDDTSATDSMAWFTVYDLYGGIVNEYPVSTSGSAGNSYQDSAAFSEVIDYDLYSYAINWRPSVLGLNMQVCGFRLFYVHE